MNSLTILLILSALIPHLCGQYRRRIGLSSGWPLKTLPTISGLHLDYNYSFGKVYVFNRTAVNFDAARNFCDDLGMRLVHVRSEDENKYLATFRNCTFSGIWFGAKRDYATSKFVWADGSNITVQVPSEDTYYDQCGGMIRNKSNCCAMRQCRYNDCTPCHKWFASPCNQTHMVACEAEIDSNFLRKIFGYGTQDLSLGAPQYSAQSFAEVDSLRREMNEIRSDLQGIRKPNFVVPFIALVLVVASIVGVVTAYRSLGGESLVRRGRSNLNNLLERTNSRIESVSQSFRKDEEAEYSSIIEI